MPAKFVKSIGRTLDARPDRLDLRDREFTPNVVSLPQQWPDDATIRRLLPRYCKSGLVLDQGSEGACTGFGLACVVNYLHWRVALAIGDKRSSSIRSARACCITSRASTTNGRARTTTARAAAARSKRGTSTASARNDLWPYRDKAGHVRFVKPHDQWAEDAHAAAARRLLPRQSRLGRRHAGGDSRDRRDLRFRGRARRLGHRLAQQVHHRTCLAAGGPGACAKRTRSAATRSRWSASIASASSCRTRGVCRGATAASA